MAHSIAMPKPGLTMTEGQLPWQNPFLLLESKETWLSLGEVREVCSSHSRFSAGRRVTLVEKKRLGEYALTWAASLQRFFYIQ